MTWGPCSIAGCGRPVYVVWSGFCQKHHARFRRHGDPLIVLTGGRGCDVDGCARPYCAGGKCRKHYDAAKWVEKRRAPVARPCPLGCGRKRHYQAAVAAAVLGLPECAGVRRKVKV
ncbi:hypothetical protein JVX90_13850 [Gordonia sp. PDNC005]|uniref:hypothetical protein n=1 Tax=Gordonia sp. PDNC005 TaxID=2811424 RepID=UPI00196685DE|nr:hypothetical protein [Gordonia sp. PDNC005]QRY61496.1 hypothetical protein JVX90_13850 [Gordonia sp. PDNC005]